MGVIKVPQEIKVGVSAARIFKAMMIDSFTLYPKIMPTFIKSYDLLQGDGGAGSIVQTTFHDGSPFSHAKHKVDSLDNKSFTTKYSLIEGALLGDKLESIHFDSKFEDSGNGGCIIKIINEYHTKGDSELKEEEIKAINDQALGFYKVTEEYLLAHPDVCA